MVTFSNDNKKVIYILGYGRSGSTLLESLLCSKFDVAAYGEIKYFFERGALDLEPCSCGKIVSDCGFWSRFNLNDIDLIKAKNFTDKYDSSFFYYFNRLLSKFKPKSLRFYKEIHYKTLAYLLDNSPQKVIIDSSKMPARAFWLYVKGSVKKNTYFIHLIRDPRGVAWSCQKDVSRFSHDNSKSMPKFNVLSSYLKWYLNTKISESVLKKIPSDQVIKLRYEDLAKNPQLELDLIKNKINLNEISSKPLYHSISGNPARFNGGLDKVKFDEEWQRKLPTLSKILARILFGHKMRKYKYK